MHPSEVSGGRPSEGPHPRDGPSGRETAAGGFGAALDRARQAERRGADRASSSALGAPALSRHRSARGGARSAAQRRRQESSAAAAGREEAQPGPAARTGAGKGAERAQAAARLLSPAAVERLALLAGRLGERARVELRLGGDLHIALTQAGGGVELVLAPAANARAAAWAELDGLVRAIQARGVAVVRAGVQSAAGGAAERVRAGPGPRLIRPR